jgi:hypothetical protein
MSVGLSAEFFLGASRASVHTNGVSSFFYWLLWMLLPIVLFAVGVLLKKQGR